MNHTLVSLEHIDFSYHSMQGEIPALSDISFSIQKGEFVVIVGPSGCGKSTLLDIIAGLLQPERGNVLFPACTTKDKPKIGYMLQRDHLFEWRSIFQNVMLGPEIQHCIDAEHVTRVQKYLKEYGLWEFRNKYPSELSGGMKQRAALIRTLALEPDLLLLDEPFSALDFMTRLKVAGDIGNIIKEQKKTALLVTHDLPEAISLADRIIVLTGRPASIKTQIKVKLTLTDQTMLAARNAPEYQSYFNLLWEEMGEHDNAKCANSF